MQQAYAKANEVVNIAQKDANDIVTKATEQANTIQMSAIGYTDSLLKSVQDVLSASITTTSTRMKNYLGTMQGYLDTVNANRAELGKVLNTPDTSAPDQPQASQSQSPEQQPAAEQAQTADDKQSEENK